MGLIIHQATSYLFSLQIEKDDQLRRLEGEMLQSSFRAIPRSYRATLAKLICVVRRHMAYPRMSEWLRRESSLNTQAEWYNAYYTIHEARTLSSLSLPLQISFHVSCTLPLDHLFDLGLRASFMVEPLKQLRDELLWLP